MQASDSSRQRIAAIVEDCRLRKAKEEAAAAAYKVALGSCFELAQNLLERTDVRVKIDGDALILEAKHGARCEVSFDRAQVSLVARRFLPANATNRALPGEVFFSLRIEKPKQQLGVAPGTWGPGPVQGGWSRPQLPDSQEAFEKAIVGWFEWAHVGAGAPPAAM